MPKRKRTYNERVQYKLESIARHVQNLPTHPNIVVRVTVTHPSTAGPGGPMITERWDSREHLWTRTNEEPQP